MRRLDYVPVRLSIEESTRGVYVNRLVVHNGLVSLLRILGEDMSMIVRLHTG